MRLRQAGETRSQIRVRSIVVVAVLVAAAALMGLPAGSASARQPTSSAVKFAVQYRGSFQGSWHMSSPVLMPDANHTFQCGGDESSGSLTSSVRPGSRPFVIVLDKQFGDLELLFPNGDSSTKGVVTYSRTAEGFLMRYSGHQCVRTPMDEPGCAARTFAGHAYPFSYEGGELSKGLNRLFLHWEFEPAGTIGCNDGIVFDIKYQYPAGRAAAALDLKKLYSCGLRKPRGCTLTMRGQTTYTYHQMEGTEDHSSTYHLEWSTTFKAVGAGRA